MTLLFKVIDGKLIVRGDKNVFRYSITDNNKI